MIQLCCTKRVQEHFAIPAEALHNPIRGNSTLGNWYLDVISIDGQACLLCMSERTLLSFLLVEDDKNWQKIKKERISHREENGYYILD